MFLVGDVMYDVMQDNLARAELCSTILQRLNLHPKKYILATIHRAENTDDPAALKKICDAIAELNGRGQRVVLPLHPRTYGQLESIGELSRLKESIMPPIPYLDMIKLLQSAAVVMTDSGGLQKEAFWLSVPCVTLRDDTEWTETVQSGWNVMSGIETEEDILRAVQNFLEAPKPVIVRSNHGPRLNPPRRYPVQREPLRHVVLFLSPSSTGSRELAAGKSHLLTAPPTYKGVQRFLLSGLERRFGARTAILFQKDSFARRVFALMSGTAWPRPRPS